MDSSTRLNQSAYDRIATGYAERNASMSAQLLDSAERMLARLSTFDTARVLDLGCGAGRDMAWFEGRGVPVTGADLSSGMLSEARGRTRGPLTQLDMRFLACAPRSFRAVWCQAALLHLPKALVPDALNEMARVLVPDGLLYIGVQHGETEGIETRPYEPVERYYAHYRLEELNGLVQTAGFAVLAQGEYEGRRPWVWLEAQLKRAE